MLYKMELPEDVLVIIKEFSRPITLPNWRTIHHMPSYKFHMSIKKAFNEKNTPVIIRFAESYDQCEYTYVFGQGRFFDPIVIIY